MQSLVAAALGLLFGLGLVISGMSDPAKVLGFLDVAGRWDPSLLMVMAGAIAVAVFGFAAAGRRSATWLGGPMQLSAPRDIDARLIGGSLVFGAGWGLAGFCPGPALTALGTGHPKAFVFTAAMVVGMLMFEALERRRAAGAQRAV